MIDADLSNAIARVDESLAHGSLVGIEDGVLDLAMFLREDGVDGGAVLIDINKEEERLVIKVTDTGNPFPDDFTPGFGIQSIYDKLEILYQNRFEIYYTNTPIKHVTLKLDSNVTI